VANTRVNTRTGVKSGNGLQPRWKDKSILGGIKRTWPPSVWIKNSQNWNERREDTEKAKKVSAGACVNGGVRESGEGRKTEKSEERDTGQGMERA